MSQSRNVAIVNTFCNCSGGERGGLEEDSISSFSFFEVLEVTSFSLLFLDCLKFDSSFSLSSSEAFSLRALVS